ncbi:hypothetical protein [Cellulomonas endophytica]|uniref:hypothetical protein n=1 Tax=Cellulomonas endophytica TaxID=2494735 RepID=UPI001012A0E7|nr:hypothetical protein [Cellulomonas endophytica]
MAAARRPSTGRTARPPRWPSWPGWVALLTLAAATVAGFGTVVAALQAWGAGDPAEQRGASTLAAVATVVTVAGVLATVGLGGWAVLARRGRVPGAVALALLVAGIVALLVPRAG